MWKWKERLGREQVGGGVGWCGRKAAVTHEVGRVEGGGIVRWNAMIFPFADMHKQFEPTLEKWSNDTLLPEGIDWLEMWCPHFATVCLHSLVCLHATCCICSYVDGCNCPELVRNRIGTNSWSSVGIELVNHQWIYHVSCEVHSQIGLSCEQVQLELSLVNLSNRRSYLKHCSLLLSCISFVSKCSGFLFLRLQRKCHNNIT